MSAQCDHGFGAAWEWPTLFDLFTKKHPAVYTLLIPLSIVGFGITAAASLALLFSLATSPQRRERAWPGQRKRSICLFYVAAAPLSMSFLKLLSVLSPRAWKVLNLLAALVEGLAFLLFLELLLSFLKSSNTHPSPAAPPSPAASSSARSVGASTEEEEEAERYRRQEASPSHSHSSSSSSSFAPPQPSPGVIRTVRCLVWQFVFVVVVVGFIDLNDVIGEKFSLPISALETVSLICCVVAELTLIHHGRTILHPRQAHGKFWTMKLLFVLNTVTARIVSRRLAMADFWINGLCYPGGSLAAAWSGTITTLVAAPVALLARQVFVPSDLAQDLEDHLSLPGSETAGDIECGKIVKEPVALDIWQIGSSSSSSSSSSRECGGADGDADGSAEDPGRSTTGSPKTQGSAATHTLTAATAAAAGRLPAVAAATALGCPSQSVKAQQGEE